MTLRPVQSVQGKWVPNLLREILLMTNLSLTNRTNYLPKLSKNKILSQSSTTKLSVIDGMDMILQLSKSSWTSGMNLMRN